MRLWPLPLIAGLAPAAGLAAAFWISVAEGHVEPCTPFIDGCVSISRAARHGLANHVFRAVLLPAAALQGLVWLLSAQWLRGIGARGRAIAWLPWLGAAAALFCILYGTFLGTEGSGYRWMRRYGIVVYFGLTYLCMAIAARHMTAWPRWRAALIALLAATLAMGLANYFAAPFLADAGLKNRVENVLEWFAGLAFTIYFCVMALLWRRTSFAALFTAR